MRGLLQLTHGKLLTIIYCNLLDAKKAGRKGRQRGRGQAEEQERNGGKWSREGQGVEVWVGGDSSS